VYIHSLLQLANARAGNGSMGRMGQFLRWIIYVMGLCTLTHHPRGGAGTI